MTGAPDPPSRRTYVAATWAAALIGMTVAIIVLFRSRPPAAIGAVRKANRRFLNPAMLHLAGRRHWYAARLEHVGRRSGRHFATPVVAKPVADGFAIPLPYGSDVDWRRNLQASGNGVLLVDGIRRAVHNPRVLPLDDVAGLPAPWHALSRLYGIKEWLVVSLDQR